MKKKSTVGCSVAESGGVGEGRHAVTTSIGMAFVWIEALGIRVGKYAVSNGDYRKMKPDHDSGSHREYSLNDDRQPVVCVNFDDATAFATWMNGQDEGRAGALRFRLPSEDEWMVCAQCGGEREYPWGDEWPPRSGCAGNYHGQEGDAGLNKISGYNDGHPVAAPVDEVWASPWGLHGVGGNVWEACAADRTGRAFGAWRGASWDQSCQVYLCCSARGASDGSRRYNRGGFRLVLA